MASSFSDFLRAVCSTVFSEPKGGGGGGGGVTLGQQGGKRAGTGQRVRTPALCTINTYTASSPIRRVWVCNLTSERPMQLVPSASRLLSYFSFFLPFFFPPLSLFFSLSLSLSLFTSFFFSFSLFFMMKSTPDSELSGGVGFQAERRVESREWSAERVLQEFQREGLRQEKRSRRRWLAEQRRSYRGQGSDMHRGPLSAQRLTESPARAPGGQGH